MESELRSLIGKYGMRAVHEGLMKEMSETYSYLQTFFQAKNVLVSPHPPPTVQVVNDIIPDTVASNDNLFEEDSVDEATTPMPIDPTVKHLVISDAKAHKVLKAPTPPVVSSNDTKAISLAKTTVEVKQQKATHREEVEKKRQELVAKGTKPETLMTESNLRTWLASGWSYMKIAKETGVHEAQVANFAKSFGLQSKISKYVAMKKA